MSAPHPLGQVPGSEADSMGLLCAPFPPQTSEGLSLEVDILKPIPIHDGHLQYRDDLKIRVGVKYFGSKFKKVALVDPDPTKRQDYLPDPSQLLLFANVYCASCQTTHASETRRLCNPPTFPLPPSAEGVFLHLDDSKTHFSGVAIFNIPARARKLSSGQGYRCNAESLVLSFRLESCFEIVATFLVQTPLRARSHQALAQPHPAPVHPIYFAPPYASSDWGYADTTVLPPPPPSQIMDINPQCGPHGSSQRVWVKVQNLPRGDCQKYLIGFGHAGMVATSFVSSEGDQVQILECATPITSTSSAFFLSLMHDHDPENPIASGHVFYTFTPGY